MAMLLGHIFTEFRLENNNKIHQNAIHHLSKVLTFKSPKQKKYF